MDVDAALEDATRRINVAEKTWIVAREEITRYVSDQGHESPKMYEPMCTYYTTRNGCKPPNNRVCRFFHPYPAKMFLPSHVPSYAQQHARHVLNHEMYKVFCKRFQRRGDVMDSIVKTKRSDVDAIAQELVELRLIEKRRYLAKERLFHGEWCLELDLTIRASVCRRWRSSGIQQFTCVDYHFERVDQHRHTDDQLANDTDSSCIYAERSNIVAHVWMASPIFDAFAVNQHQEVLNACLELARRNMMKSVDGARIGKADVTDVVVNLVHIVPVFYTDDWKPYIKDDPRVVDNKFQDWNSFGRRYARINDEFEINEYVPFVDKIHELAIACNDPDDPSTWCTYNYRGVVVMRIFMSTLFFQQTSPARRFLVKDGDHAITSRVLLFMVPKTGPRLVRELPPLPSPIRELPLDNPDDFELYEGQNEAAVEDHDEIESYEDDERDGRDANNDDEDSYDRFHVHVVYDAQQELWI